MNVTVTRTVTRDGQIIHDDVFRTHYLPWRAIYEYGPGHRAPRGRSHRVRTGPGARPVIESGRNQELTMISDDLLEILRCPACVREKPGLLKLVKDTWLVCQEPGCGRKYPIVDDIPVMLIETGDKWVAVAEADLPVPPPED